MRQNPDKQIRQSERSDDEIRQAIEKLRAGFTLEPNEITEGVDRQGYDFKSVIFNFGPRTILIRYRQLYGEPASWSDPFLVEIAVLDNRGKITPYLFGPFPTLPQIKDSYKELLINLNEINENYEVWLHPKVIEAIYIGLIEPVEYEVKRKNPDADIRQLERIAFKTHKTEDVAAYWRACLRANILPRPTNSVAGVVRRWRLSKNPYVSITWEFNSNYEHDWPEHIKDHEIIIFAPPEPVRVMNYSHRTPIEEVEEFIKDDLRKLLEERRNPDTDIRQLERIVAATGKTEDRLNYWRACLRANILPQPTQTGLATTRWGLVTGRADFKVVWNYPLDEDIFRPGSDPEEWLENFIFADAGFHTQEKVVLQQKDKQREKQEVEETIKDLLRWIIEQYDSTAFLKRNPDSDIRQLERIAVETNQPEDIANYWRACLRAGILPTPAIDYGSTFKREIATYVWELTKEKWPRPSEQRPRNHYVRWSLPSGYEDDSEHHELTGNSRDNLLHGTIAGTAPISEVEDAIKELLGWLLEQYEIEKSKMQRNPSPDERIRRSTNKLRAAIESLRVGIPVKPDSVDAEDPIYQKEVWKFEDREIILVSWVSRLATNALEFRIHAEHVDHLKYRICPYDGGDYDRKVWLFWFCEALNPELDTWKRPTVMKFLYQALITPPEMTEEQRNPHKNDLLSRVNNISLKLISEEEHSCQNQSFPKSSYYLNLLRKIKERNICEPIILRKINNKLLISDGWHRFKIAQILNWTHIPAIIFTSEVELHHRWADMKQLGWIDE